MNLKETLIEFYQILTNEHSFYNTKNIRGDIASKAEELLDIIDKKNQIGIPIDDKIFSFLNFIKGYDTPRYEDNEYLFNSIDLEREFNLLGDINTLEGINTHI